MNIKQLVSKLVIYQIKVEIEYQIVVLKIECQINQKTEYQIVKNQIPNNKNQIPDNKKSNTYQMARKASNIRCYFWNKWPAITYVVAPYVDIPAS